MLPVEVALAGAGTTGLGVEPETPAVALAGADTRVVRVEPETPAVALAGADTRVVRVASGKEVVRRAVAMGAAETPALVVVVLPERLVEQRWDRVTR